MIDIIKQESEPKRPRRSVKRKVEVNDTWCPKVEQGEKPDALDHPGIQRSCSHFGFESVLRHNAVRFNCVLGDALMVLDGTQLPFDRETLGKLLKEFVEHRHDEISRRDDLIRLAVWALRGAADLDDGIRTRPVADTLD